MPRPLTRTHMAAADSFFSNYIKDQKSLSPFCLVHCLQSRACSSSHDEKKGQEEEEEEEDKLNQSSLSVSLFESPYLKPHPLPAHQMRTPSNNVATPLTLQVDRVERVWSPTMATPTPKLTRVSLMSDLGTSCSSIDQSEREEEEGGGGGQEREVRFKERARIQGSELIVRRLFHSQPDAAPVSPSNLLSHDVNENDHVTTNIDLNSTHNSMELFLDEEELNSSPQLLPGGLEHSPILLEHVGEEEMEEGKENDDSQHFNDSDLTQGTQATSILKTNGSGDDISPCKGSCEYNCLPASEGVGTKTDASPVKGSCVAEKSSPILSARGISLDVLFMSNSQLDDMETKGTSQDEKLKHSVTEKVGGETGGADENRDPQILRLGETPPLKRPRSPDPLILNKKSKSLQARPRFEATPTTVTALSDDQPTRKDKMLSSAASVGGCGYYQTPLSRPKVPSSCFKAPRSRGEVSEREERTSTKRALANFNPLSTSTPSVTKGSGVRSLFKTGSGKDLMISDRSIEKAKLIFDEDGDKVNEEAKSHRDGGCGQGDESGCGPEDSEGWTIPSDFDWDEFNTFTQLPSERGGASTGVPANQTEVAIVMKPAPNVGFKSASGCGLTVSSKALSFACNLLSDIDEARATPIPATPTLSTANRTGLILNEAVPITCQTGFTTASGRGVPISSKALENAKRLLSEEDSDAPPTTATPPNQFGFTTASGKSISVSSKSLKVAKELFKDDEAPPTITTLNRAPNLVSVTTPTVTPTNHLGFTTASGKEVTVSGKSLSVVRELLSEEAPPITAHTTVSRVGVCSEVTMPTKHAPPTNIGFTTASGKRVNVSEKSLKAVKGIFSDDETPPPEAPPPVTLAPLTMNIGFTTASGKTVPISEKALEAVKGIFAENKAPPSGTLTPPTPMDTLATPTNIGFTTASGKEVPVSREALQAVRGLLADTEILLPLAPPTHELVPPTNIGFTTASGKNVAISEKSLQAVKGIFSDTETPPTVVTPILAPPTNKLGFTTGSGKEVRVSDESLKTIRKLFSDDNTPEAPPTHLVGFTTAGGKGVAVSSESLEVAKSIFDDDHLNDGPTSTFEVPGPSAAATTTGSATGPALGPTTPISSDPTTREKILGNAVSTPNLRDDFRATPFAPPNKFLERSDLLRRRVTNRKGRFSRPEGLLCDRSNSFKAKRAICQENEATPTTTPSHLKFQKGTPSSLSSNYRRPKRVSPVWEGDLANSRKRSQQQTTPPPSSPLFQLTPSQLSSLTNTSPLSPGTLNSSRLNINDTPINAPPPPLMLLSPGQEVQRQEGTIATARGRSRCQRVPLVATATAEGGVGGYSEEELLSKGVCPSVLTVSAANASGFVFEGSEFFSPASLRRGWVCVGDGVILKLTDNNRAGVEELWNSFSLSPGVDSSLISKEWFINHYRWVVWKLAAMEVCFPNRWAGRCLTVDWCLMQLKYRYDTEIDQAKRSIIHKICEGDDTPTRHMILCVCHVTSENNENNEVFYSLELTDGWYSIPAKLDRPLSSFVGRGLVCVGGKLAVFGAEISGDPTNGHPLEVSKGKHLLLSANSVRRAHWSARLGLLPRPLPILFPLGSIVAAGGVVPAIEVVVARRYPVLYVEKAVEGDGGGNGGRGGSGRVFRRRHEEERVEREWEERRQKKMENIYERIERQFKEEEVEAQLKQRKRRSSRVSVRYVKQLQDGEEIYNQLQSSSDPDSFMELLSSTQRTLLESYQVAMATKKQEEFQSRLKKAVDQAGDELPPTRNVSQLLRLVLVQYGESPSSNSCVLNAWNVGGSELRENLKEGVPVRITKATANSSYHEGQLQLSSGKSTTFSLLPKHQPHMINYTQRQFTSLCVLSSSAHGGGKRLTFQYNEIDTVGLVVTTLRQRQTNSDKTVDILYLTDADRCLLVIKAWEGLKSVTPEGVVTAGCLVAVSNLRYQVGSGLGPPTGHVTDRTVFSQRPLEEHLTDALTELKRNLPINLSQYLQEVSDAISESVM